MELLENFMAHFDLSQLLLLLFSAAASLLCITFHEICHGYAAYRLGDRTAKQAGRLTLNPLAHIDPLGLLLMVTAHVGWAKPVPVDIRFFKRPRRDMALTALAGPVSNFALALAAVGLGSLLYRFMPDTVFTAYVLLFLCYAAVLSVGLGLFNLIPIPPLDGSKLLFSLLPDRLYYRYLRYERYSILLVLALAWFGAFDGPLDAVIGPVIRRMCALTRFPAALFTYYFGL